MGRDLRQLLEEGVRVAYRTPAELARFTSAHHVSPSLVQLLEALQVTFRSSVEALAWLDRRAPAADRSPFELIAAGEAYRAMCVLAARAPALPVSRRDRPPVLRTRWAASTAN
jgi:hypothetical protein